MWIKMNLIKHYLYSRLVIQPPRHLHCNWSFEHFNMCIMCCGGLSLSTIYTLKAHRSLERISIARCHWPVNSQLLTAAFKVMMPGDTPQVDILHDTSRSRAEGNPNLPGLPAKRNALLIENSPFCLGKTWAKPVQACPKMLAKSSKQHNSLPDLSKLCFEFDFWSSLLLWTAFLMLYSVLSRMLKERCHWLAFSLQDSSALKVTTSSVGSCDAVKTIPTFFDCDRYLVIPFRLATRGFQQNSSL